MPNNLDANPFRPTAQESPTHTGDESSVNFTPILHRWERYRLWYNAALVTYTLLWSVVNDAESLLEPLLWFQLCFLGALCNLFFFLGPAMEAYGCYFRIWSRFVSSLLFLIGLILTSALATIFLTVRNK